MGKWRQLEGLADIAQGFMTGDLAAKQQALRQLQSITGVATGVAGMQAEQERLKLAQAAGKRAEALMPSQIQASEELAGLRGEQRLGLQQQRERAEEVRTAIDAYLKEEGLTSIAPEAVPEILNYVQGIGGIARVREAIRLGKPKLEAETEVAEKKALKAEAEARVPEADIRRARAERAQEILPEMIEGERRSSQIELELREHDLRTAGRAEEAAKVALQREQQFRKALSQYKDPETRARLTPEAARAIEVVYNIRRAQAPTGTETEMVRFYTTQLSTIDRAIATAQLRTTATVEDLLAAVPPESRGMAATVMALSGRTGALTPEEKQQAISGLVAFYNTLLENAQKQHPTYTWPSAKTIQLLEEGGYTIEHGGAGVVPAPTPTLSPEERAQRAQGARDLRRRGK